jgi:predicted XRE-type DNA-binding protein
VSSESIIKHVTPVGGNVFADLGFSQEEANQLLVETDAAISEKLVIKQALMNELVEWIEVEQLKQSEAAKLLGVTRPRISDVVNKKVFKFTIDALVDMLARAGKDVKLTVQKCS